MNKKLRRLLGRDHRSEPERASKKKRSKRSLPSLLSQRPNATENYYCRSTNVQQEESYFNKGHGSDLKKGDLIVNTQQIDGPADAEAAIEVTLEPIKDDDVEVQTLQIVNAPIEQKIKTQQITPACEDEVAGESISNATTPSEKETFPHVMEQGLEAADQGDIYRMGASSKFVLHNASPQALQTEHDFQSPNQRHQNIETGYANDRCVGGSFIKNANMKHPVEVACPGFSQPHQDTNIGIHPEVSCTRENSFSCAFLQEHDDPFAQGVMQTNCPLRLDSTVRLEKCQHQQSAERWPRSEVRNKCSGEVVNDCDWGWVSTNNDRSTKPTSYRECQSTQQSCHPNAGNDRSRCHRKLFESSPSSACCHGNTTSRFFAPERSNPSKCNCCRQEHCNSPVTSSVSHCLATECPFPKKRSSPLQHNCGRCFDDPCFWQPRPQDGRHSSISFLVQNDKNSFEVHEIPCLSQEENRFCDHQLMQQCSVNCCHGDERFGSTLDWDPHALRAWERPLTAASYATTSADSCECEKRCCHKFNSSREFRLEETAMAPCVTFFSDVPDVDGPKTFSHQSGCCRRSAMGGNTNLFWKENFGRAVNNKYTLTASFAPISNRVLSSPKFSYQYQLSSKAFAKLIAYCRSKNILPELPTVNNAYPNNCSGHRAFDSFDNQSERIPNYSWNDNLQHAHDLKPHVYQNQAAIDLCRLAGVFVTVEECPWYWGDLSGQEAKKLLHGSPVGTFLLRDSSDRSYLFSLSLMTKKGPTSIRIVYNNGIFRFDSDGDGSTSGQRRFSASNSIHDAEDYRKCVIHMILQYTKYLTENEDEEKEKATNLYSAHASPHTDSSLLSQRISNSVAPSCDQSIQHDTDTSNETNREGGQFMCSWMGRCGRREIQVSLTHPLLKRKTRSLQELSRISISKRLRLWNNAEKIKELTLPFSLKKFVEKYPYPI